MNFGLVPDDSPLNYDEWRALLGLPEVSEEIKIRARYRHAYEQIVSQVVPVWKRLCFDLAAAFEPFAIAASRWTIADPGGKDPFQPEPDRTPQQRALPRPASTPPMWANNPTKTRRKR